MTVVLIGVVAVCVAIFFALAIARRTPSSDDGVASFRKHLDALSPEARRQVIDRMNETPKPSGQSDPDDPGISHGT
ncbi:MAG: hypothetical protein ACO39Y_02220 [Ilumatobacteraceae bacterium]|jgi:site-specific recombinase|nr:hypothetical protein [Actinomycetota bacterium]MDA3011978.1 hypothetical protein [Actinomycetota bacterium]MDA3024668.1 hypothetical protein [Actinomycetota bacterium]NBU55727.1 hypothetical protein [Acidimicrobiia bacterium]